MYTRRVDRSSIKYSGLNITPVIFQEEVRGVDVRVTVVGNEVFACRIEKLGSIANEIDWRQHQVGEELRYQHDAEFPSDLSQKCVTMVREMGLSYGAFDFIDADGKYYFLEVNPNGQWGFVEVEAGLEISKAFARLMQSAFNK